MIVITGAAGFIGSCLVGKLNQERFFDLALVDDFSNPEKNKNLEDKRFTCQVDRRDFFAWLRENESRVQFIFHIGARTDTTEFNEAIFDELNLHYTQEVWKHCVEFGLPLVYASSAATYGLGELGYADDHGIVNDLQPLNPYGRSKNDFDKWALAQEKAPYFWAGLKFFNVFGPNEYHKGRMASVVMHATKQIRTTGAMKLFQSHREDVANGEQKRDFVYVKDVVEVLYFLMHHRKDSGIYNLGTGQARTFNDLALGTFRALDISDDIQYIPTPEDIRDTYQYYTQADMEKLRAIGYDRPFTSFEEAIDDYVKNYLVPGRYF